jgi:hypothetical protein
VAALPASASARIADAVGSADGVASEGGVGSIAAPGGAVDAVDLDWDESADVTTPLANICK